jgi:hypothetical protein
MTTLERTDATPALYLEIEPVLLVEAGPDHDLVIDDDHGFTVTVTWEVAPAATAILLTGTWTVRVYAESVGPGPEKLIGLATVAANGGKSYSTALTVPAHALPSNADPAAASGVYHPVVVLSYETNLGGKTQITGFGEGPTFMIRTP